MSKKVGKPKECKKFLRSVAISIRDIFLSILCILILVLVDTVSLISTLILPLIQLILHVIKRVVRYTMQQLAQHFLILT